MIRTEMTKINTRLYILKSELWVNTENVQNVYIYCNPMSQSNEGLARRHNGGRGWLVDGEVDCDRRSQAQQKSHLSQPPLGFSTWHSLETYAMWAMPADRKSNLPHFEGPLLSLSFILGAEDTAIDRTGSITAVLGLTF